MTSIRSPIKTGTCELCGGHNRERRILVIADFMGWACAECVRQLRESKPRIYCGTVEHTEPGE